MCTHVMKVLAISVSLLIGLSAHAQDKWKFASSAQPGSVLNDFIQSTVDNVNKAGGKEFVMEKLFVGSEQETVTQIARGRMEMGNVSFTGASVLVPEAGLLNMPYLWRSEGERDFVIDNHALPVLKKSFEAKGLVIVRLGDAGWNDVFCKKVCLSPADVKGAKVRVSPSAMSKMFWESLDTNGVQMPLTELFPALQSNMVEAADLPFLYYVTTPAAQSAPHYVLTRHLHHPTVFIFSKAIWDKLTPERRAAVQEASPSSAYMRKAVSDSEKPRMEEFKAKGGFVHELTPAQRQEWSKLVEPHQQKLVASFGAAASDLWNAIQNGKKAYASNGGK